MDLYVKSLASCLAQKKTPEGMQCVFFLKISFTVFSILKSPNEKGKLHLRVLLGQTLRLSKAWVPSANRIVIVSSSGVWSFQVYKKMMVTRGGGGDGKQPI